MKKTNALRILDRHKIAYTTEAYDYDPAKLSIGYFAEKNGIPVERIYKTLVAKGNKTGINIAVIPGQGTLDFKKLSKASGNKKMTLVPVKDLLGLTGYIRGGCSPMGMKKAYPVFVDVSATAFDEVFVNAGKRGLLVGLKPQDLVKATKGQVVLLTG